MSTANLHEPDAPGEDVTPRCPLSLTIDLIPRMLNFELAEHPIYDGFEVQWFDDDVRGTGMLAFLSRRADRRVDYYPQRGLRLDPASYAIGGGTRSWNETDFEVARLEVAPDGVDAEVRFTDVDGRTVEVRVDDRDGRRRRRGQLLAPVSADIDRPEALLLVWMPGFDLVRAAGTEPVIRIGGRAAATGRLPGAGLHRRHLIKYAAPLCAVEVNRRHDGPLPAAADRHIERTADTSRITALAAAHGAHRARVELHPGLPEVGVLADGATEEGQWHVTVDDARLTGGRWRAERAGTRVMLALTVTERWKPGRLPWLMRLVTTVVPVFRRWPTTYRWRAAVRLGPTPTMRSGWERTSGEREQSYRRVSGT